MPKPTKEQFEQQYITPLEMIWLRNHFYYTSYRRLLMLSLGLILILMGLVYFYFYEVNQKPPPRYFATNPEGTPLKPIPLTNANMDTNTLLLWATEAATSAYTFNFANYHKRLQETRNYFTHQGYLYFLKALKDSGNLDAVIKNKLVVYAKATGPAILLKNSSTDPNFHINDFYSWQVQIPMVLTYEGGETFIPPQNVILTMIVMRISQLESLSGVGIESFVLNMQGGLAK